MKKNTKCTSKAVATVAAKSLKNPKSSKLEKSLAGSALAQAKKNRETGKVVEKKASNALKNLNASKKVKKLAGSLVSQANKLR